MYEGLKVMKALESSPNNETMRDYVIPAVFKHGGKERSAEKTLETLSSYTGIPLRAIVPSAMQHLILERNIPEAIKFGQLH